MSTAGHAGGQSTGLCLTEEMMVQELGWNDDVDDTFGERVDVWCGGAAATVTSPTS